MSTSGIIEQSCGDAKFEILSPTSLADSRNHLMTPSCDTGTGDMYLREDLLKGAQAFCGEPAILTWWMFQIRTKGRRENIPEHTLPTQTFWYTLKDIHPAPGKGAENKVLRIHLEEDIRGCDPVLGSEMEFAMVVGDECVAVVMNSIDGCKYFLTFELMIYLEIC